MSEKEGVTNATLGEVSPHELNRTNNSEGTEKTTPPQHGGGPATAEGKLISAQNARKHSFFAKNLFRPEEVGNDEYQQFTALLASLTSEYQPRGVLEHLLLEKIVTESIRFRRLLAFENDAFASKYPFFGQAVDKIQRYQSAINRQLFQALAQLERSQKIRAGDSVPAPISVDIRVERECSPDSFAIIPATPACPAGHPQLLPPDEDFTAEAGATEAAEEADSLEEASHSESDRADEEGICGTNSGIMVEMETVGLSPPEQQA